MLSIEDCLALCDLTEDEVHAIAQHEHIPEVAAAEMGNYLLLAERDVEIVADRGFNGKVSAAEWEGVCRRMEAALREGRHAAAVVSGVEAISRIVARHFPPAAAGRNELPDRPARL